MFKRVLLAFTFVVALGAAGVGMSSKAMAYGCDYGYGYRAAYYPPVYASYRSYGYGGPVAYPQVNYYPGSYAPYPVYYGGGHRHHRHHHHHRHHDHHGHGGLRVSFGF